MEGPEGSSQLSSALQRSCWGLNASSSLSSLPQISSRCSLLRARLGQELEGKGCSGVAQEGQPPRAGWRRVPRAPGARNAGHLAKTPTMEGKDGALVRAIDRALPSHTSKLTHYMITHNVYPQTKCVWKTITFKKKSVLLKFYYADCSLRKLNLRLEQLPYAAMKRVPTAVKSGVPSKCVHFLSSKALAGSKMPKLNMDGKHQTFKLELRPTQNAQKATA